MRHKICLIAPYQELADMASRFKRELSLPIDIAKGNMEEGLERAKEAEKAGANVIISRGGTASLIRRHVKIPVVEIQVTGYDVFRVICPIAGQARTIAILGYSNVVNGCRTAGEILGIPLLEFILVMDDTRIDWDRIREQLRRLINENGVNTIIGDTNVITRIDFPGVDVRLIASGPESIIPAVEEASRIVRVREEEQETSRRFQAVLDFVHDGVIATDEKGLITVLNPVAEQIFRVRQAQTLGKPVTEFIHDTRIDKVLKSGRAELGELQKVPEGHILTNRIPIHVDGVVKGVVATFQEVSRIQDAERTIRQNLYGKGLVAKYSLQDILTIDSRMKKLVEIAAGYARTIATLLIQGESGTGKELFAQGIHQASQRSRGPFVAVNCAALPPQLLESELFGYVEGAFTGAKRGGKIGLFELAHRGTIFLDEIGDMDKSLQARLLRVLEEKRVMRLGSDTVIPVDVRVVAATNTDLKSRISSGQFRMDLYYRLNVLNLPLIPLRERPDDIPLLAAHFFERFSREHGRNISHFPADVSRQLEAYPWPGNVRELRNVMERIVLSVENGCIHLPTVRLMVDELRDTRSTDIQAARDAEMLAGSMQDIKQRIVRRVLKEENWNKSRAARRLDIDRATVDRFTEE